MLSGAGMRKIRRRKARPEACQAVVWGGMELCDHMVKDPGMRPALECHPHLASTSSTELEKTALCWGRGPPCTSPLKGEWVE